MTQDRIPRRSFLTSAAATVAGTALGVAATPSLGRAAVAASHDDEHRSALAPVHEVKLGIASYSLREFPLEKALDMAKTLRTPYINFKSMHVPYEKSPEELAAIRKEIEDAGFKIVGGGTITFNEDTDAGVEKYFAYAKAAGMPTIVCTGPLAVLPRVEKYAKQYDIKVAIHNHGTEDKIFPSPYDVLKAVKGMDTRMGLCMDIGHTVRTGTDPVKAVFDAGTRLHDMHAKDLTDLTKRDSQVAVGEGKIPIAAIFQALQAIRYPGYVNLEYEINAKDPLPGMQISFAHMRGVLAGLAQTSVATAPGKASAKARG
ncbi:MAG TPA: sugar phosphate isomerase/epimerase [Gemmatimonadaceae bacterium]|nr:sugar phosphate isomerase/epimerase [Gemmatimonadaceae bacterium]